METNLQNEIGQDNMAGGQITNSTRRGLSGSTIKIIAIIVMFIDHIGAVIVERILMLRGMSEINPLDSNALIAFAQHNGTLLAADSILRMIGRLGFPIFCFLLIEGFKHTRDVKKYALRLLAFAAISEIPFNLAVTGNIFDKDFQNVFFTLFIGLLVMMFYRYAENKQEWIKPVKVILDIVILIAGMTAAALLKTDYAAIGVFCIIILYIFRRNKTHQIIAGCVSFLWEITAPLAFIPIAMYNGKRGLNMKYAFYVFYPAHLLFLYAIACFMGIA